MAAELVVTNIELVKKMEILKTYRQGAGEAVGVDVEEGEIGEEAEEFGQCAGDICMV